MEAVVLMTQEEHRVDLLQIAGIHITVELLPLITVDKVQTKETTVVAAVAAALDQAGPLAVVVLAETELEQVLEVEEETLIIEVI